MTEEIPAHHTPEHWATKPRKLDDYVVKELNDHGTYYEFVGESSWCFMRDKADIIRDVQAGDVLQLETVGISLITGLADDEGWLFHLTDQDLADQAIKQARDFHRSRVEDLERHRKEYAATEEALPDWLRARITYFREKAGEKFLLDGWGYELGICRYADLLDRGLEEEAEQFTSDEGMTGNQVGFGKALVKLRKEHGDGVAIQLPAALSPITGSRDYT